MSPKTIPKSNVKAALKPLVILVSSNTKKPGPIEKANNSPQGIAVSMSCKCKFKSQSEFSVAVLQTKKLLIVRNYKKN